MNNYKKHNLWDTKSVGEHEQNGTENGDNEQESSRQPENGGYGAKNARWVVCFLCNNAFFCVCFAFLFYFRSQERRIN